MTDEEIKELQAKAATAVELAKKLESLGDVESLQSKYEAAERERKELIEARDKAKEKARKEEEERLAQQGEFKTLAEQREKEAADLKSQLESLTGIVSSYKERDENEFKSLIEKVPEHLRESINDESIPLAKRLELARGLSGQKNGGPGARPPGENDSKSITRGEFDAMTHPQRQKFLSDGGKITD